MSARSRDQLSRHDRRLYAVYSVAQLASFVSLMAGVYAAVLGWRPAAFLMIAGLTGTVLSHLWIGVVGYREVMARSWPDVKPLEDEEDDQ